MRALILILNVALLVAAWWVASLTGVLIAAGLCFVLVAGFFAFSMASTEARESRRMQRAMGRNTTFLAELLGPRKR
jgi:Flp pilus assembly protein TadB